VPDETNQPNPASANDKLPGEIVEAIAESNASAIGEQPAILANLALANEIFNMNLAQQSAIVNQQMMFQLELAALAKCIQVLLTANVSEPHAIENLTARILEMFDQFHSKTEERLVASQTKMNELMKEMRAHVMTEQPEET
jgi:hypothetical protein